MGRKKISNFRRIPISISCPVDIIDMIRELSEKAGKTFSSFVIDEIIEPWRACQETDDVDEIDVDELIETSRKAHKGVLREMADDVRDHVGVIEQFLDEKRYYIHNVPDVGPVLYPFDGNTGRRNIAQEKALLASVVV